MNYIIIIIIIILLSILLFNKINNNISSDNFSSKILKYYGAHYCPYSNKDSITYTIIKEFEQKYPDVLVEYYWSEEHKDIMINDNISYVPTIKNSKNESIELNIPTNINIDTMNKIELNNLLLQTTYNKL